MGTTNSEKVYKLAEGHNGEDSFESIHRKNMPLFQDPMAHIKVFDHQNEPLYQVQKGNALLMSFGPARNQYNNYKDAMLSVLGSNQDQMNRSVYALHHYQNKMIMPIKGQKCKINWKDTSKQQSKSMALNARDLRSKKQGDESNLDNGHVNQDNSLNIIDASALSNKVSINIPHKL